MVKAKGIEYRERLSEWRGGLGGTAPRQVHFWETHWDIDDCHRAYLDKLAKQSPPLVIKHHMLTHDFEDGSSLTVNVDTVEKELLFINPDVRKDDWNKEWGRLVPTQKLMIREWGDDWTGMTLNSLEKKFHKECLKHEVNGHGTTKE